MTPSRHARVSPITAPTLPGVDFFTFVMSEHLQCGFSTTYVWLDKG